MTLFYPRWLSESPCWVTCEAPARVALGITTYLSIKTMVKSYILNLHLTLIRKFSMIICIYIWKWFDFKITLSKAFTFQSGMPRVSYVKGKRFHWEGFAIWYWLVKMVLCLDGTVFRWYLRGQSTNLTSNLNALKLLTFGCWAAIHLFSLHS